jgi:MFS family permease
MSEVAANNKTSDGPDETTSLIPASPKSRTKWHWTTIILLCIILAISFDIGDYLIQAPRLRLYESIICTEYYSTRNVSLPGTISFQDSIPEEYCKLDEIQDEVAMIVGWQLAFDSISSIVLAVPYGWVADKYGRKPVLVAALGGCVLAYVWTLLVVSYLGDSDRMGSGLIVVGGMVESTIEVGVVVINLSYNRRR